MAAIIVIFQRWLESYIQNILLGLHTLILHHGIFVSVKPLHRAPYKWEHKKELPEQN